MSANAIMGADFVFSQNSVMRDNWNNFWSQSGWYVKDFSDWLTQALAEEYGELGSGDT